MADNLVRNPGFEDNWSIDRSHRCLIIPVGANPYEAEIGNIFTPSKWLTWFVHEPNIWDQPEVRDAWITVDPRRVHEGQKATLLFTFYRKHDGGFLQTVPVEVGQRLRLSAWCHAWSNHDNIAGGHPDDPYWSDGAGEEVVSWDAGMSPQEWPNGNFPYNTSDAQTDAKPNFTFWVGIDPKGGRNPLSSDVVWGEGQHNYNGYVRETFVEAVAENSVVTVFLRSKVLWQFKHCDYYVDAVDLRVVEPPPPPREYDRTYVLLPNNQPFDPDEQLRITALNPGVTLGPSADDAAIGHPYLKSRTVISYQPQTWGGIEALEAFWEEWYGFPAEGDTIEYREAPDPPPSSILQWQCDPRWRDYVFGDANCHQTLCQAGCFVVNLSMSQKYYNIDPDATPTSVDAALGPAGFVGCVSNWAGNPGLYASALQLKIERTTDIDIVNAHIDAGNCVMAEVSPVSYEHFVLVIKRIGNRYWCLDSYKNTEGWLDTFYSGIDSWRLVSKVSPPQPDPKGRIGLHLQQEVGDWRGLSAVTTPMKFLAGIQNITTVKQLNPDSFPVWRQHVENQGVYLDNPNHDAGANAYLDTFRDSMEEELEKIARTMPGLPWPWFGVESLNETYAHGDSSVITKSIPFDRAWIRTLAGYPEVSPVVYCAAVGNIELPLEVPGSQVWKDLVAMGKEGMTQNATWGYHAYWYANPAESGLVSDWDYLAGRWTLFDDYLVANGAYVNWFFGECGAVGGYPWPDGGYNLFPNDGWKAPTCYGGDWGRYEHDLLVFNDKVRAWNAMHGGRAYGGTLFTTGGGELWKRFEIGKEQINRLITILS